MFFISKGLLISTISLYCPSIFLTSHSFIYLSFSKFITHVAVVNRLTGGDYPFGVLRSYFPGGSLGVNLICQFKSFIYVLGLDLNMDLYV